MPATIRTREDGFTLVELMIVMTIISILSGLTVPSLLRAKMVGNETSAIGSLSALRAAEISYATSCGSGSFAVALSTLGKAPPGSTAAFISPDIGSSNNPIKSGYQYTMAMGLGGSAGATDCNGTATKSAYLVRPCRSRSTRRAAGPSR